MRRPVRLAIVALGAALAAATLGFRAGGPVTAQAQSCSGCTDFVQGEAPHNKAKASNSACFIQSIGTAGAKENEGSISTSAGACGTDPLFNPPGMCFDPSGDCFVFQEIGTVAGSNRNKGTISTSTGQTIGLDQLVGSIAGNDMFDGVTGSSSNNTLVLKNAGDDTPLFLSSGTGGCGPASGEFCGQLVAGGNSNKLSWTKSHGDSQEVFFFDVMGGKGANNNTETLQGGHNVQWITNGTNPDFITAAETGLAEPMSGGVLGKNASKNKLDFVGSNSVQLVQNGSRNTLNGTGNFINETILNGSNNTVNVKGQSDTVTIDGLSTTSTADGNSVTITGNDDIVTLIGLSDQHIVINGNGIVCDSQATC